MSIFTKAGDIAHNSLIEAGGSTLTSNLTTGLATGAVLDGGIGIMNGDSPGRAIIKGATKGALLHGAYKGLGNQYTKGVSKTIDQGLASMTKNTTSNVRSNFKISNFTNTAGSQIDSIGHTGKADLKNIAFQDYNI